MYSVNTKNPGAWVCANEDGRQNRGRLKIHKPGSKIYLQDEDEFEIELHNPTTLNVKAVIKIDGKPICSGGLVLRSGERIYLECFPDSRKKFTFKTYEVDDSNESKVAISNNGRVEIKFYKEKVKTIYCNTWTNDCWNWPHHNNVYYTNTGGTYDFGSTFTTTSNIAGSCTSASGAMDISALNVNDFDPGDVLRGTSLSDTKSIETGQVDGGEQSEQEFTTVDMSFESYSCCGYNFQILPISQKPISKKEFRKAKKKVNHTTSDKLDGLIKLGDLLKQGIIDQLEFDKLKSELI
tara:strand:+ start:43398 stop:44279 length:882 start_codon:yes stop_codon:yes gene_type:complete